MEINTLKIFQRYSEERARFHISDLGIFLDGSDLQAGVSVCFSGDRGLWISLGNPDSVPYRGFVDLKMSCRNLHSLRCLSVWICVCVLHLCICVWR